MTTSRKEIFLDHYGPWALVAGASTGLGAEFASQLAARGLNVVLAARGAEQLEALAARLQAEYSVQTRLLPLDLSTPDATEVIATHTVDIEIGLLVYNAGFSAIGPFLDQPIAAHLRELDTNCRAPLMLIYTFASPLLARKRGGVILMSSLSASYGSPLISNYAATKAYNLILAESLWEEWRREGVDVLACRAASIDTPNYRASAPARTFTPALPPQQVVAETLAALGKQPSIVPGLGNQLSAFVMQRLFLRRLATTIMGRTLRAMYERTW